MDDEKDVLPFTSRKDRRRDVGGLGIRGDPNSFLRNLSGPYRYPSLGRIPVFTP